jgi:hypothetical protein
MEGKKEGAGAKPQPMVYLFHVTTIQKGGAGFNKHLHGSGFTVNPQTPGAIHFEGCTGVFPF